MNNEPCRLKSFGDPSWSKNCPLSCLSLAKEGLYYTGKDAEVRCFKCGLQLDGRQDRILEVRAAHRARAPGCPFRNESLRGPCNIPLPVYSAKGQAANAIKAYLGGAGVPDTSMSGASDNDVNNVTHELNVRRRHSIGTDSLFPSFSTRVHRSQSFNDFQPVPGVSIEDFVQAGFFFTGVTDTVICYYCGLALRNWQTGDDPRIAHARLQPGCDYFRDQAGPEFVLDAQRELRTVGIE
ncbi:hypothetical protein C0Q70_11022 [Pomacea canaliculata]|uniref:Uncharacterized protein n=2 Tax=Pomacea canaliculata TaxID=400727 RepID=A0A2T7P4T3_POMCA|nr:hypothetical protein C0Q70_11022 [Pomacea canaliculata]